MSQHYVNVVSVPEVKPHPNADKLELVEVEGYTCVIPKGTFKQGDVAAFIEPDYVVPATEQFAFLGTRPKDRRIGAKKLRGIWSQGLLTKAPEGAVVGQNVMEQMGIERWEPPEPGQPSWMGVKGPPLGVLESVPDFVRQIPKYDLENIRKYVHLLNPGEVVLVTEKLHGTNARYVWHDGRMYCGSRTQWRKQEPPNVYWKALDQNQWIEQWCMDNPNVVLCGEIFGAVQDLRYGAKDGEYRFRAFDLFDFYGGFRFPDSVRDLQPDYVVPVLGEVEFDYEQLKEWAEQDSYFGGIREGLVIQPQRERETNEIGRVKLKLISNRYLSR